MIKEKHKFEDWIVSVDANAFSGEGIVILPKTVKIVSNVENNANIFITSSGVIISSKNEIPSNEIWYRSDEICNFGQSDIAIQESTEDNEYGCKRHIFSEDLIILPQGIFSRINPYPVGCGVENIFIPNSVTSIGNSAFYNCEALSSITIPNSVTSIGKSAFSGCSSITSVVIPDSVTSIGESAFTYCDSLTSITIPNSVTSIGKAAFYYCSALTSVTISKSITSIGDWTFQYCRSLTSVTIPNSVTYIGERTFEDCRSLTSVTIPNNVTSIGDRAFYACSSLTSITCKAVIPPTLGSGNDLTSVTVVYVPVESINDYKTATNWSYYSGIIKPIE